MKRDGNTEEKRRWSYSPSSFMRCCLLRRESKSKEKSDHSSRGGKDMVWRRVKRTASMTRSPRASEEPTLTVEAPLVVRTMWGGGEKSMACRCSMMPFQMRCWNSAGIFSLDRSYWSLHRGALVFAGGATLLSLSNPSIDWSWIGKGSPPCYSSQSGRCWLDPVLWSSPSSLRSPAVKGSCGSNIGATFRLGFFFLTRAL